MTLEEKIKEKIKEKIFRHRMYREYAILYHVPKISSNKSKQQVSYCKRCNVQNEYMDFNSDWTCYSCRS